jgi:hypothetical protein
VRSADDFCHIGSVSTARKPKRTRAPLPVIGWREWVGLPALSPDPTKVKIDTGARTSALHAFNLRVVERDGIEWADFEIHPAQRSAAGAVAVSCEIAEFRRVRSSSGQVERRPVIRTSVQIGPELFDIDVTLTSRDEMGFRMLLGRAAIRRRFLVDPGRSYVQSRIHKRQRSGSTD